MTQEEVLFVQIRDAADVRRTLLGCSKQTIVLLQRYERFKTIRTKKLEAIIRLRSLNRDITLLLSKLNTHLPATATKQAEKNEQNKRRSAEKHTAEKVSVEHVTDLDKLENELAKIESKMKNIS